MSIGDRDFPQIDDNYESIIDLLAIIARNTGGIGDESDFDPLAEGGHFFTTGEHRIEAPTYDEPWEQIRFPFPARSVAIRHYDSLQIAFVNPNSGQDTVVLEGEGSYEIGGQPPLGATTLWYRTHEHAEADIATFRVEGL